MAKKATKTQVLQALRSEDASDAARLGPEALPHLKKILADADGSVVMQAIWVAGRINNAESAAIVDKVSKSRKLLLRIAAANAARHLDPDRAEPILTRLLKSRSDSVRKCAILSAVVAQTPRLKQILSTIEQRDPDVGLQKLARESLRKAFKRGPGPKKTVVRNNGEPPT